MRKALRIAGVVFVALYVGLCGTFLVVMRYPSIFGQVMRHTPEAAFFVLPFKQLWFIARAGSLRVGDPAPDFRLTASDKKTPVQLSSLRGQKPVVLIFGSYT